MRHQREEEVEEESDFSEEEQSMSETASSDEEEESDLDSNNGSHTTIDIWKLTTDESEYRELSIAELYKEKVLFSKSLKKDNTHKAIMHTLQKAQEEEDMDFNEALDYAVDKRKFLIQRKIPVSDDDDDEMEEK